MSDFGLAIVSMKRNKSVELTWTDKSRHKKVSLSDVVDKFSCEKFMKRRGQEAYRSTLFSLDPGGTGARGEKQGMRIDPCDRYKHYLPKNSDTNGILLEAN